MDSKSILEGVKEALEKAKKRNFKESVELAINLKDVDLSNPKNRINEEIVLPKGRGKPVKVALFAGDELAYKAKDVADLVIPGEEIPDLGEDKKRAKQLANEYDFFLAETTYMPLVGKHLGVVLGPRGKMPKPIPPSADPRPLIENLRKMVRARSKDRPTFHVPVGVRDMPPEEIAQNIEAVLSRIISKLERGEMNIRSAYVKTTMGPAVRIL
ncbi:MAG: 50S ribosomal protein L1 [Thermoplasmata archaeon]|nr:50S ribosomal protein L1 [Thermoplasmata archaeon]HDD60144.1 50S ribosomal protein L1 [Euryarchaeota archaeon]RLF56306.1 MAG: 50S ribosomal protein L1 [Thermoplasmata archaeon]RLF72125.1 MAG: 50S ribosomal protein L1 [Thermoplasmata archaeon]RLF72543.1 MAG: 50S ribosomal protein L1 [Thermoplasmata archaeon]